MKLYYAKRKAWLGYWHVHTFEDVGYMDSYGMYNPVACLSFCKGEKDAAKLTDAQCKLIESQWDWLKWSFYECETTEDCYNK